MDDFVCYEVGRSSNDLSMTNRKMLLITVDIYLKKNRY